MSDTIYKQAVAAGIEIDHHESDLYLKDCKESREVLTGYRFGCNVRRFVSQVDGAMWFDVPFAYDPFWAAKTV